MSINTTRAVMSQGIRTPDSLILLQIEIIVPIKQMNHLYFYFGLCVSEGTKLFKITPYIFVCICFTKFRFVTVRVINLFDFIMWVMAVLIITLMVKAKFVTICVKICPAPISFIMVVNTCFSFVEIYVNLNVPLRRQGFVLWVLMSNLKNSPYSKYFWS